MGYAVVLGEALVDLLGHDADGEVCYRPVIGGAPLNVAVAAARLGGAVEFVGALGSDRFGDRIAAFLTAAAVGTQGVRRVAAPTALAIVDFDGAEPTYQFYGEPPSYALLGPDDLDPALIAGAAVVYTGSICLLREPCLSAARAAWRVPGPARVFDPNVRAMLLPDAAAVTRLRDLVAEFAANADLVKLSSADAAVLYDGRSVPAAAEHLRAAGARTVVITCGAAGAHVSTTDGAALVPAPAVHAVDATGAGDAVMGALVRQVLERGVPRDLAGWQAAVRFALSVAGLVCERPGGAVAMPTWHELDARWANRP